jgi:hypothetical protein
MRVQSTQNWPNHALGAITVSWLAVVGLSWRRAVTLALAISAGFFIGCASGPREREDRASSPVGAWPARVDGEFVAKTFRFRPASTEWRVIPTRRISYNIVFKIEDADIPADYFVEHCRDTEVERFRKILEGDDGYITVVAIWVNDRIPREDFHGAPEYWVDGRLLVGSLQSTPMAPNRTRGR